MANFYIDSLSCFDFSCIFFLILYIFQLGTKFTYKYIHMMRNIERVAFSVAQCDHHAIEILQVADVVLLLNSHFAYSTFDILLCTCTSFYK